MRKPSTAALKRLKEKGFLLSDEKDGVVELERKTPAAPAPPPLVSIEAPVIPATPPEPQPQGAPSNEWDVTVTERDWSGLIVKVKLARIS